MDTQQTGLLNTSDQNISDIDDDKQQPQQKQKQQQLQICTNKIVDNDDDVSDSSYSKI